MVLWYCGSWDCSVRWAAGTWHPPGPPWPTTQFQKALQPRETQKHVVENTFNKNKSNPLLVKTAGCLRLWNIPVISQSYSTHIFWLHFEWKRERWTPETLYRFELTWTWRQNFSSWGVPSNPHLCLVYQSDSWRSVLCRFLCSLSQYFGSVSVCSGKWTDTRSTHHFSCLVQIVAGQDL